MTKRVKNKHIINVLKAISIENKFLYLRSRFLKTHKMIKVPLNSIIKIKINWKEKMTRIIWKEKVTRINWKEKVIRKV